MKRAIALFSLISLIFLPISPALAQVSVDQPVLPEGYANWSYTKTYTCKNPKDTVWGEINKEKKTLEILAMTEANGQVVAYDYIGSDSSEPKFFSTFLMQDGKWLMFDGTRWAHYNNFLNRRDGVLRANGITSDCIDKMNDSYTDFIDKMLKMLRSKN